MKRYYGPIIIGIIMCLLCASQFGCQSEKATENDDEGERETEANTNSEGDEGADHGTASLSDSTTEDDSATEDTEAVDYYQLRYTPIREDYHGDQGELDTYTATSCVSDRFNVMNACVST